MEKHPPDRSDFNSSPEIRRQKDEPFPKEQVAARQSSENQVPNEKLLCDKCRAVDWHSLPTLASDGLLKIKNKKLRSLRATSEELKNSSCRICSILSIIKSTSVRGKKYVLEALPLSRHLVYDGYELSRAIRFKHPALDNASQCTVLGIMRENDKREDCYFARSLAVISLDDLESIKIAPSSIDYNKLKDLVKTCDEEHKTYCAVESHSNVSNLEVIDTKTQEVIKAPDQCKYMALSYVWGKQLDDSSVHNIQDSPPVIKDAISVTNSMGYNYLWVDRYCISDHQERPRIISQMDQIYANASITIIAAANGDTEMGLCGVSKPRRPQKWVEIEDSAILELPFGPTDVTSSKWASRGWTYQEGYLSTKRLIFTNTQVLFLCNRMYAAESLQQLLNTNCCAEITNQFKRLIPRFAVCRPRFKILDLRRQAEEYSKRELTRSGDSLSAFLGVLNYYAKNSANLTSPVLQLPWGLIAEKHAKNNTFSLLLFWFHEGLATRRSDIPSWSWTGWGGPLKFTEPEVILQPGKMIEQGPFSYLDWKISMRDEVRGVVTMYDLAWEEFEARRFQHRLYQPGPKEMQVSCMVIPVCFQNFKLTEDQKKDKTEVLIHDTGELIPIDRDLSDGVHATLQVWKGVFVGREQSDLRLDQQLEQQDYILGLVFAGRDESYDWTWYRCLLVRQVGEGLHERVGLLYMNGLDLDPHLTGPKDISYRVRNKMVYRDAMGNILDNFRISNRQRKHPFTDTAELRTICIV